MRQRCTTGLVVSLLERTRNCTSHCAPPIFVGGLVVSTTQPSAEAGEAATDWTTGELLTELMAGGNATGELLAELATGGEADGELLAEVATGEASGASILATFVTGRRIQLVLSTCTVSQLVRFRVSKFVR